jgi:hypothetical protein
MTVKVKYVVKELTAQDALLAKKLKEEGIAKVTSNNKEWMAKAIFEVRKLKASGVKTTFDGEWIRLQVTEVIGLPTHSNTWGALINWLVKLVVIIPTGEMNPPKSPKSHARDIKVYRWSKVP